MDRLVKWMKLTAMIGVIATLEGRDICAQDVHYQETRAQDVRVHDGNLQDGQDGGGVLRVSGDAGAVHLELRGTTIKDVLVALSGPFDMSVRSATALDEVRDGTYRGSLRQVIARLLDGYDYVVKYEKSQVDVVVFGKVGRQAVPVPQPQRVVIERREAASRGSRDARGGTLRGRCAALDAADSDC
jgi:hypothetical protein